MANLKIIAIVVVIVLVVAGAGVFLLTRDHDNARNEEINFITGLEAVGSGIYFDDTKVHADQLFVTDASGKVAVDANGNVKYRSAGWDKLVLGTPGITAIQHVQLKTIVEVYLKDSSKVDGPTKEYKLVLWTPTTTLQSGNVYFVETGGGASGILNSPAPLDGGLTWQPQLVKVVADDTRFKTLVRTNELFPHQTCCILIANESFVSANPEITERVVWAIVKATDWINEAKAAGKVNPNDPRYVQLLTIARSVSGPAYNTTNDAVDLRDVALALADIEYDWGNVTSTGAPDYNSATPLGKLKSDVALQTEDLINIGTIKNKVSDLGFSNYNEYANAFVNDTPLKNVLKKGINNVPTYKAKATVRFVLIQGDLHQLPVHVANAILSGHTESFYSQVGITFQNNWVPLGNAVLVGLKANEADFGVSGQPTIISDNVNNKLTTKT